MIRRRNQSGFTLIEILMVLILIAVLAAIATNAFINFKAEANNATLQADLAALRAGINGQYAQMQLRCQTLPGVFPPFANLVANDITNGGAPCTVAQVTISSERAFVQGGIPNQPWTNPLSNTIIDCSVSGGAACTRGDATFCNGTTTATENWCYNPASGEIWVDSATAAREAL